MNATNKGGFWDTFVPVLATIVLCVLGIHTLNEFSATIINDNGQFQSGAWISAGMVTPDAAIWQAVAIPILVLGFKLNLRQVILISTMIAFTHEVYGLAGLAIRGIGGPFETLARPIVLLVFSYLVIGFVVNARAGEEGGDNHAAAKKLLGYGIVSVAAFFTIYTGVSVDELFAVLGRVEWMVAQGWSLAIQALNITTGMTYLWLLLTIEGALLYGIVKLTAHTKPMQWLDDNGDHVMFLVFSLLIYFISRGWYQNALGNQPTELVIGDFNTGFAPWVYLVGGFVPMTVLALLLKVDFFEELLLKLFYPQKWVIDKIEDWSERRAGSANDVEVDSAAA